jgi:hypothetical protein
MPVTMVTISGRPDLPPKLPADQENNQDDDEDEDEQSAADVHRVSLK